jgi:transposase InsO family protein
VEASGQSPNRRSPSVRHAEKPNQTVNVDLCFVPTTHQVAGAVPAVSGSSGKLVVCAPKGTGVQQRWPGRVFEHEELPYCEAMDQFVVARLAASSTEPPVETGEDQAGAGCKATWRAVQRESQQLPCERRQERERRQLVDQAWKARQQEHQQLLGTGGKHEGQPQQSRRRTRSKERGALQALKRAEWAQRHRELAHRRQDDAHWREQRRALRQREQAMGLRRVLLWIAVLVVVDNCTRRCLGLPLFVVGAHVTADLVVAALQAVLPKDLQYLLADGGTHFTAEAMQELARGQGFVRVPLARHRPQSNGIAERFIETLKAWLTGKPWQTTEELEALLAEFLAYYNDRPHQGRELSGLSPNEYSARLLAI